MKTLAAILITALLAIGAFAQSPAPAPPSDLPANIYAIGGTYSPNSKPEVAGTALWAHKVDELGTYAGGIADFVPTDIKHATVTSNVGAFVAQKLVDFGKIKLFAATSAGLSTNGSATGWAYSGGGLFSIPIKNGYGAVLGVRFIKSNVSGGTGYQLLPSLAVSWGK